MTGDDRERLFFCHGSNWDEFKAAVAAKWDGTGRDSAARGHRIVEDASGSGLPEFMAARYDEAEAVAQAAAECGTPEWTASESGRIHDGYGEVVVYDEGAPSPVEAEHIAACDPKHRLADIALKRAILAAHRLKVTRAETYPFDQWTGEPIPPEYEGDCEICGWFDPENGGCLTVRHLGTEFAEHPGYKETWKPRE